jgi:hypothetical protein
MGNYYYTSHKEIVKRLSKKFKTIDFDTETIHDWCAEAENDILRDSDYFQKFVEIPLEIKSKRLVTLPCNIHSIIDVYFKGGTRPRFFHNGNNITLSTETDIDTLYIDYKGTPVDPNSGDVLIMRGHELFCEWTCIKNISLEKYLNGEIDGQRWSVIDEELYRAENIAVQDMRRMTRKDFEDMEIINGNMLPMIGQVPMFKNEL